MSTFKDHFSKQSDVYVKYRPHYPQELYTCLAGLTTEHSLAWDCGTGNGQAATGLADFYNRVIATDPSSEQIRHALQHPKVEYRVEKGEQNSLLSGSADIITLGNALHWLDFNLFYQEVNRVLKPGGILAAWAYTLPIISPEIDAVVKQYHDFVLGDYWLPENRLVEKEYTTIPFPFEQVSLPTFFCEKTMNPDELIGYLNTWSATQRFIEKNGFNPTEEINLQVLNHWKNSEVKPARWKLILKVGRKKA